MVNYQYTTKDSPSTKRERPRTKKNERLLAYRREGDEGAVFSTNSYFDGAYSKILLRHRQDARETLPADFQQDALFCYLLSSYLPITALCHYIITYRFSNSGYLGIIRALGADPIHHHDHLHPSSIGVEP